MPPRRLTFVAGILLTLLGLNTATAAAAAPVTSAKVLRLVEGKEVFIDNSQAQVNQTAAQGSLVSTRRSRAELLFNTRAIGLLGRTSAIRVGARCFRLDSGVVVINGTQRACIGSRILGVRGTTYVLKRESDETYTVSVLAGESLLAPDLPDASNDLNILSQYPRINPSLNIQAGGFGGVYPTGGGSFIGGASYFSPIYQSSARQIVYSSTSVGSTFQDLWGVSTEIGYRRLAPSSQSISSVYLGYAGYGAPGCFSNQVTAGAQWEKSRWRIGASGGVKVNDCLAGLSFGALNLSIPIGSIRERPLYLSISPYFLNGNVVTTDLLNDSSSNSFPGIRTSLEVPISSSLSARAFAGADSVFGVTLGGFINYRFPTRRQLIQDYSSPLASLPAAAEQAGSQAAIDQALQPLVAATATDPQLQAQRRTSQELARLALAGQAETLSDLRPSFGIPADWHAQALETGVVREGQKGRISADGELLSVEAISNAEFLELLTTHLKGQNPLPESRRIAKQASERRVLNANVAGFLGLDFLANATQAVSTTVDTPFSPTTQMPSGRYVCAATELARNVGAQAARPGQFSYTGQAAYFGRGSQTSQGYPATDKKADAYVFSDPGVCTELNRQAGQGYDVVRAEQI